MSEANKTKPHSQEYFGEWRDFWWNRDFVKLMAERWHLEQMKSVLDVGCGIGHWSRVLAPFLETGTCLYGVDREPASVARAGELMSQSHLETHFKVANAEQLPFADAQFDMVTCQTLLIHVPDVKRVLKEMLRVLKPNGLLAIVEPNNSANRMIESSLSFDAPLEERLSLYRFYAMSERGKAALGLGHNSVGDLIPGLCAEVGVKEISVYLSDKTSPYIPPYTTPEQQVNRKQWRDWIEQEMFLFSFDDTLRYFIAGGGTRAEFDQLWGLARRQSLKSLAALEQGHLHSAGGGVTYLISGYKP